MTYDDQIATLETEIRQLKDRCMMNLKVRLAEARNEVADLERQLTSLAGSAPVTDDPKRVRITIDQIAEAIRKGATNYRKVAALLGCAPATVARVVKREGRQAGIRAIGNRSEFTLVIK